MCPRVSRAPARAPRAPARYEVGVAGPLLAEDRDTLADVGVGAGALDLVEHGDGVVGVGDGRGSRPPW